MIKTSTIFAAALISLGLAALPALAQEAEPTEPVVKQHWSFAGPFGTFDQNQLQRGFQVFQTVCSTCHSARLLSFRNLAEPGGPHFSEEQVKALAATYQIADPTAEGGMRPGLASDRWPDPFKSEQEARDSNGGALPPDMSVLAKARSVEDKFPNWLFNYFTTYAEGGPDYIHALVTSYVEPPPAGVEMQPGKHYNKVFPGHAISMPPPLADNQVPYGTAADGTTVPLTVDQYARDVAAFLMWVAEPHLNENKAAGFRVLTFLLLFAVLMWLVKQRVWRKVEH